MNNYIYEAIKKSEYLKVFIKRAIGDNNGTENYLFESEILKMTKELNPKILNLKIRKELVWYYNLYISKDTRHNINLKILNSDIKKIRQTNT